MHIRHVTGCPSPATYTAVRRRPAWQIYTCRVHRHLPDWPSSAYRRLTPEEVGPACGTVYDHRPAAEIVTSHMRGWIGATGTPEGSPILALDDWRAQLRAARTFVAYIRHAERTALLDEALRLAADGTAQDLLPLLAAAETADAKRLYGR